MTGGVRIDRVLQIHTKYRQAGGEDAVVAAERSLLEGAGVDVRQVVFDNADLQESKSLVSDMRLAGSTFWSGAAHRRVHATIRTFRPNVMHVHNTFTAASPSVYAAAATTGTPVVQTLHNYRLVCPVATLFRDGHVCTECVGRSIPWPAIAHACIRGSRSQSFVVAATIAGHRARGTFREIAAFLALTNFQRDMMIRGGIPASRIRVVPNFLEPDPGRSHETRAGVLFVGRLAVEKGVEALLEAAALEPGVLAVAGDGPLGMLAENAHGAGDLTYLGNLTRPAVLSEMKRKIAVVVPSVWFEGFPIVVLEAFATGTPVIASRIGSLAELVEDGVTGLLAEPNNPRDLAERIRWARTRPDEMKRMGDLARKSYESRFRGDAHLAALLGTYRAVVSNSPA